MKNKLHNTIYFIGNLVISFWFIGFVIYMPYWMSVNSFYPYVKFIAICIAIIFDIWLIRKYKRLNY